MTEPFKYTVFPILETDRLRLRQMTDADVDDVFSIFGDAETCRYLIDQDCKPYSTAVEAKANVIDWSNSWFAEKKGLRWALTLKDEDRLIGTAGFNYWNQKDRRAEIGYDLNRSLWGRGLMTEAVAAMLRFGFHRMNLHRIEATVTGGNIGSVTVLEKCGFTLEGVWRHRNFAEGQFYDSLQFGLLEAEFKRFNIGSGGGR